MNINKINPSTLKITDVRFADIDGAPKRCTLMKVFTNQGLVGYGEVRDASSRTYAAMLKSRILGENPCNVEKVFRRIKQFGGDSRQAGGVWTAMAVPLVFKLGPWPVIFISLGVMAAWIVVWLAFLRRPHS